MKITHGYTPKGVYNTTYWAWAAMKDRCKNKNHKSFKDYGERGITYDPAWEVFENFLKDMGDRPQGLTLDRIDNNGNYCEGNCRWATPTEQSLNKRTDPRNTSGRTGVCFKKQIKRWIARGQYEGVNFNLYCGPSYEEACAARDIWDKEVGATNYGPAL